MTGLPRPAGRSVYRRGPVAAQRGFTAVELLVAMALAVLLVGLAVPVVTAAVDAGRVRQAAGFVAAKLRAARLLAVSRSASVGLVFDQVGGRWVFQVCADENGDGLHRADIASGDDACVEGPYDVQALFPGVQVAVDAALRGPGGEPGSPDAVRFGRSDMASFSPIGSCTAGSLFLRSPDGRQYAVRVAGVTGRTRILRYEPAAGAWLPV
jgi:prepilin-type N-terminal cleavage/methylation domain-containing protein